MEIDMPTIDSSIPSGKAYVIGTGEAYGELGLGDDVTSVTRLTLIEALKDEDIVDVQSSYMHSLALTKNGKIWSWGGNEFGALGREGIESIPQPISHISIKYTKFSKIACGYTYSMAISSKGQLYSWGTFTSSQGVFGYFPGTDIQRYPRIVGALAHETCVEIAVGKHHCICLTSDGSVYSWGCGEYWQLGRKVSEKNMLSESLTPQRLSLKDIISIACGAFHSLALDHQGQLYTWGQNNYGQCGVARRIAKDKVIDASNLILEPTLVPYFDEINKEQQQHYYQSKNLPELYGSHHHTNVSSHKIKEESEDEEDDNVSVVIDNSRTSNTDASSRGTKRGKEQPRKENDQAYSKPRKKNNEERSNSPQHKGVFKPYDIKHIVSVAAGDHSSTVLMSDNTFVVFGRCEEGQLGIPLYPGFIYPGSKVNMTSKRVYAIGYPIVSLWAPTEKIINLTCGCNSSLVLTESGKLFFWGVPFFTQTSENGHEIISSQHLPALLKDVVEENMNIIAMSIGDNYGILVIE
ncbi:hypothetical protein G6F70_002886 [Rhizopus microsporus]|uniref:RCC1-like domain-containing protein n=2 Tax=Rhizopus TaxID=4842 RepID=A0A367J7R4_RHIAZ|nr:hypothetical protein G6F71_001624 [Rhizopus microsporus]RCH85950.1 hypothetical protein CU097_008070 [Rhizopus azygosporus]KAG1201737.1 hypothetical protein G6F70_002886 [Rhizopus microsporus]KAG1213338.1 hypothetical protein G6F69_002899 [Rhizopus microsporus]KAG1235876.1 hypothetical protein G6F67_002424 [Rhizopus microsporus]